MIDHLFHFPGEVDLSTLPLTIPDDVTFEYKPNAQLSCTLSDVPVTLLCIQIVQASAVYDSETEELISEEQLGDGSWIALRARQVLEPLKSDPRLVSITDDQLANQGLPFIVYKNDLYPWEALQATVRPTFAGSKYPFGSHVDESQLVVGG